jgi:hypothetical protein
MEIDDIHATSTSPSGFGPGMLKVNLSRGRRTRGWILEANNNQAIATKQLRSN